MHKLLIAAILAAAWLTAPAHAQRPEIFVGPNTQGPVPGTQRPVNFLAKCLADPTDRMACLAVGGSSADGGLEAADIKTSGYVLCNAPGGICLVELATLDLAARSTAPGKKPLASVDVTILFDFDVGQVRQSETGKLKQLAAALLDPLNAKSRFAVIGHTDSKGSDAYNCGLSDRRANAVRDWLRALGVAPDRLVALAAGEHVLRNKQNGEAAENRRVGFAKLAADASAVVARFETLCKS